MVEVSDFVVAPSVGLLSVFKKEQLLKIAEHYKVEISNKRSKEAIKGILCANLVEMGVLEEEPDVNQPLAATEGLTFEQKKEMMLLKLEFEKTKHRAEIEKELELKRMEYELEQTKLSLEKTRLDLIKSGEKVEPVGAAYGPGLFMSPEGSSEGFDILGNLRLLPRFNEKEPEAFFSLFERVAEVRKWPESARTVMLQCVLTGRAQEAYSALSVQDGKNYECVKAAVLKTYELVPEAYRQRFRTWKRHEKQTHLEFARDLTGHFTRWCSAMKVETFAELSELMVLEQFKNSVSDNIAQHINDLKVKTVAEAAAVADDYVLTHKRSFVEARAPSNHGEFGERAEAAGGGYVGRVSVTGVKYGNGRGFEKTCSYCRKRGHIRADCYALKARATPGGLGGAPKAACCTASLSRAPARSVIEVDGRGKSVCASFLPFISDGHVSLVDGGLKVPVKILRDTAAFDSFVQASVLPFSDASHTGCWVPVVGMEMSVLRVPLHKIVLYSDLFQGESGDVIIEGVKGRGGGRLS